MELFVALAPLGRRLSGNWRVCLGVLASGFRKGVSRTVSPRFFETEAKKKKRKKGEKNGKTAKKEKNGNGKHKKRKKTKKRGRKRKKQKKSEATPFRRPLLQNPDGRELFRKGAVSLLTLETMRTTKTTRTMR